MLHESGPLNAKGCPSAPTLTAAERYVGVPWFSGEESHAQVRFTTSLCELATAVANSGLRLPELSLRYRPSPDAALEGVEAIERELAEVVDEERRRRRPLMGPHRDQLDISWGAADVSQVGSAGEKKALGLLLLRAQAAVLEGVGRDAVVLADDLDAELDLERLTAVWAALSRSRQLVVTSNRPEVSEALDGSFTWAVKDGSLSPSQTT